MQDCRGCRGRGINPARPGYLYLVIHDGHRALKWGIANLEQRISQHVSQGWQLVARWDFEQTSDAWAYERQIKTWVRGQGIPRALTGDQMKYGGHTETAFLADVDVHLVRQYIESLTGWRPNSPPLP